MLKDNEEPVEGGDDYEKDDPEALKGGRVALKGYETVLEGDKDTLNDSISTLTVDGKVLKSDRLVFRDKEKALKTMAIR